MLFPAAFVTPTAQEVLQFELGRIKVYGSLLDQELTFFFIQRSPYQYRGELMVVGKSINIQITVHLPAVCCDVRLHAREYYFYFCTTVS